MADIEEFASKVRDPHTEYHAVHFIGHGSATHGHHEGVLYFTRDDKPDPVPANALAAYLSETPVRFLFLNTCESGSPLGNVARHLVESGVPVVLGLQTVVADRCAIALARVFYQALADGYPVDLALVEARLAVLRETHGDFDSPDWAQPVLYVRSIEDADLFA